MAMENKFLQPETVNHIKHCRFSESIVVTVEANQQFNNNINSNAKGCHVPYS